jgi:hypothetical protein
MSACRAFQFHDCGEVEDLYAESKPTKHYKGQQTGATGNGGQRVG